ncbi:hypothetical protein KUU74_25965 [Pseudomonas aeruginosa]|uniref:hypothetical protein n=1 Tax=Pseudomonadota TaxID=1224 RepID=UPI0011B26D56|nr:MULTISPECIES: hypothetical protein [Pseudomonadota]MBY9156605.1 hypothetical protein [Pseudomonas aeruginosa]QZW10915.1 hypothetical protein KUU74_25965 [Pseudomonas aeruginosa]
MTAITQRPRSIHVEIADTWPRVAVDFEIRPGNKLDDQLVLPCGRTFAFRLPRNWSKPKHHNVLRTFKDLASFVGMLCRYIAASNDGLICVRSAGKGPTDKSRKIRVAATFGGAGHWGDEQEVREHTITVPASQLIERDGNLYAPRWLIRKTLHQRIGQWPIAGSEGEGCFDEHLLWPAFDSLVAEFETRERRKLERQEARTNPSTIYAKKA